jgi:hypothetical protein
LLNHEITGPLHLDDVVDLGFVATVGQGAPMGEHGFERKRHALCHDQFAKCRHALL